MEKSCGACRGSTLTTIETGESLVQSPRSKGAEPQTLAFSSPIRELDGDGQAFHICSYGSRDTGHGAQPWPEGAYALRRWLSRGHEVHEAVRLSEAARSGDAGLYARAEFSAFTVRVARVTVVFEPPNNRQVGSG
jgi:hypothetical protein